MTSDICVKTISKNLDPDLCIVSRNNEREAPAKKKTWAR